jgi:hypothetical protein
MPYTSRVIAKQSSQANAYTKVILIGKTNLRCYTCNKPFDGTRQAFKIAKDKYQCLPCQQAKI